MAATIGKLPTTEHISRISAAALTILISLCFINIIELLKWRILAFLTCTYVEL